MRFSQLTHASLRVIAIFIPLVGGAAHAADRQGDSLAVPVVGTPFNARLIAIDSNWNMSLDLQGDPRVVAAADLIHWGTYREDTLASRVILRDGSILVVDVMDVDGASVTVESSLCPATAISRESLAGLVFAPPATVQARDRLLRRIGLQTQTQTQDLVLLKNGDQIAGRLTAAPASAEPRGALGLRAFGLALRADRASVPVAVEDTVAVLLPAEPLTADRPGEPPAAAPVTWLGLQDGSLLGVVAIDIHSPHVSLTLACGQRLTLPAADLWNAVCLVQPLGPATRYLSDLNPLGYQHAPFLELKRTLGRDRNVLGGQLRAGGCIHLKGLGMATTSRVVYELTDADRRFAAELALDDAAGDRGSAVYRIFLEKQQVGSEASWQAAFTSPVVRGGDSPRPMSLDLTGATRIALVVDFADRGDARDYANWLGARLLP